MAEEVIMPKWGLTMDYGTVGAWRKREGDPVAEGEILVEIETEKITNELESPSDGVLARSWCRPKRPCLSARRLP